MNGGGGGSGAPVVTVVGRQGSGKGTQGERLAARFGMAHLSTGDVLRAAVAAGDPLGREVERVMAAGELVSDELIVPLVADRLAAATAGVVLDGFPRTVEQADALERRYGRTLDLAIHLVVPERTVLNRMLARRVCEVCGRNTTADPLRPGRRCECGGRLVTRADDNEASIARRLAVFEEQTVPVLAWFADRERLVAIDGDGDVDTVTERLLGALSAVPWFARVLL